MKTRHVCVVVQEQGVRMVLSDNLDYNVSIKHFTESWLLLQYGVMLSVNKTHFIPNTTQDERKQSFFCTLVGKKKIWSLYEENLYRGSRQTCSFVGH